MEARARTRARGRTKAKTRTRTKARTRARARTKTRTRTRAKGLFPADDNSPSGNLIDDRLPSSDPVYRIKSYV
jgi:hypothetical protein